MANLVAGRCRGCGQQDSFDEHDPVSVCVSCRSRPSRLRVVAERLDRRYLCNEIDDPPRTDLLRKDADAKEDQLTELGATLGPCPSSWMVEGEPQDPFTGKFLDVVG